MSVVDDLQKLERQLGELVTKYEQYFIGFEKREPLLLFTEVEALVRRYSNVSINNTMYKHKYTMLVARFNTYREHWSRILRLIEEGRYSRDRFIRDLHHRQRTVTAPEKKVAAVSPEDRELDRIYQEFRQARESCNLPVDMLTREMVAATLEKHKPVVAAKLGDDNITFRVVVENGKPKIKARLKK